MTVTVSYDLGYVGSQFYLPSYANDATWSQVDLASTANGGIVAVGNHSGSTELQIYDAALDTPTKGAQAYSGTAAHVAAIDGYFAIASVTPTFLNYSLINTDGSTIGTSFGLTAGPGQTFVAADITIPNDGGLVAAVQINRAGDDSVVAVNFRVGTEKTVLLDSTANDGAPSICALNDGGVAVAWTVDNGAGVSEVWTAVFEANGDVRAGPTLLDNLGSVNRGVSAVALADGGFGVAYEDSDYAATGDIAFAHLDANNALTGGGDVYAGFVDVTAGDLALPMSEASTTLLSNGMVAISYSIDYGSSGDEDKDIRVRIVDPSTNTVLDTYQDADSDFHNSHASSSAALGLGGVVTGWTDDSSGNQAQQFLLERATQGDKHPNVLAGDSLIDIMYGGDKGDGLNGAENDDQLYGGKGNDTLTGGAGVDILDGGKGGDTAGYGAAADAVYASLADPGTNLGDAAGDTYISIENLTGSNFDDFLYGNSTGNRLVGRGGADTLFGYTGRDTLVGGAGNDELIGGGAGDTLNGGGGTNYYTWNAVSDSTGHNYDTLVGMDFSKDVFYAPVASTGLDPAVIGGSLSGGASFNSDLKDAVKTLGAGHLVLFEPDAGGLAGHAFLIVDQNNQIGYQPNEDLVMDVTGASHLEYVGGSSTHIPPGGLDHFMINPAMHDANVGSAAVIAEPHADVLHMLSQMGVHGGSALHEMFF